MGEGRISTGEGWFDQTWREGRIGGNGKCHIQTPFPGLIQLEFAPEIIGTGMVHCGWWDLLWETSRSQNSRVGCNGILLILPVSIPLMH